MSGGAWSHGCRIADRPAVLMIDDGELDDVELDPETHFAFYRIAQEALGNVAQHSQAAALGVRLESGPPVTLVISDDGVGFDPDDVPAGHLGLTIMRERAEGVGAQFEMTTGHGRGTTIELRAGWR